MDKIGSNLIKLFQAGLDLFKLDKIGSKWINVVKNGSNWFKLDHTCSNLMKLVQTWSNWIKEIQIVQTGTLGNLDILNTTVSWA